MRLVPPTYQSPGHGCGDITPSHETWMMQVTVKSVDGRDQMFQRWPAFTWPHTLSTTGSSSDVAHVIHPLREPGYSWCTKVNAADITVGRHHSTQNVTHPTPQSGMHRGQLVTLLNTSWHQGAIRRACSVTLFLSLSSAGLPSGCLSLFH